MSHHVIEYDEQCHPCAGTGVYVGFAEKDGAAVQCHTCNGTGCHHVVTEYDDFEGRRDNPDVTRVFQANPGIGIGHFDRAGRTFQLTDFGGMSYSDWKKDQAFPQGSEMREFTCPAWWYQTVKYDLMPRWRECNGAMSFALCQSFPHKSRCWERFDREHPDLAAKQEPTS